MPLATLGWSLKSGTALTMPMQHAVRFDDPQQVHAAVLVLGQRREQAAAGGEELGAAVAVPARPWWALRESAAPWVRLGRLESCWQCLMAAAQAM